MITHLDFEISSLCNAGCPVCPRRDGGVYNQFNQTYWTLSEVQRVVGDDLVSKLEYFNVCGNFGDGMGNPEVVNILKWVRDSNPSCHIHISTNGGIGKPNQYKELAKLGVWITFGIDGYGDKNELYRINAKWKKVEENIRSFSENVIDKNQIEIQFLLWDQTRDQIKPIYDFCTDIGCNSLFLREPFTLGQYTRGYNMKGEYTHSLTYESNNLTNKLSNKKWSLSDSIELNLILSTEDLGQKPLVVEDNVVEYNHIKRPYEYTDFNRIDVNGDNFQQTCYSKNSKDPSNLSESQHNLYITYDGYLMPCCMIPPEYSLSIENSKGDENDKQKEILNKLIDIGIDKFSLNNRTINEVLESGVLHEFVYNNFENNTQFIFCKTVCGKCN